MALFWCSSISFGSAGFEKIQLDSQQREIPLLRTEVRSYMDVQVLIIGGGATGAGLARDLTLRGVQCTLLEQADMNSGASGANHGLLHSGARYVYTDPTTAKECREEAQLLKRLAPHCVEETGGLFVAVAGDDEKYISEFPSLCTQSGIPVHPVDVEEALQLEPSLSDKTIAVYKVEDATVDPFKLTLENIAQAEKLGCNLLRYTKVVGFDISGRRIRSARLLDTRTGEESRLEPDIVVSTAGAWAKEVAALAGILLCTLYCKGSMLVTSQRMSRHVINRLRPPSDGDILVPGGTVSILGTTSLRINSLDRIFPTVEEVDLMIAEGTSMLPALATTRYVRAYAGVRPLVGSHTDTRDQDVSRGFAIMDHRLDGIDNFVSVTGGKLTTYRLMAEKAADLVCDRLRISAPCPTRTDPLPDTLAGRWTEPGRTAKEWVRNHEPDDALLCDCEMVPKSSIDSIVDAIRNRAGKLDLMQIGQRSRLGKGSCQGTFCAVRLANRMVDFGDLDGEACLEAIKAFQQARWKGQHPILWGKQIAPAELKEGLYCGLLGVEL